MIVGLIVAGLAVKYQGDASRLGGSFGIGGWVMMLGGLGMLVGSIMGFMKK